MAVFVVSGVSAANVLASPIATTTLSAHTSALARRYATTLLNQAPVPSGARLVTHLPTPLDNNGGTPGRNGLTDVHRDYLVSASFVVETFVTGHLRNGYTVNGTGNSFAPGVNHVTSVNVNLPCPSRHVTYCGLTYSATIAKNGQGELRLDLQVVWLPITTVEMPTIGAVSVTGYGTTSLMGPSSDPTTVVLSFSQAQQLHTAITTLKNSDGGLCMEDETLLKIVVTPTNRSSVRWSATADACPGVLAVQASKSSTGLDDHSCAFWRLVASFFPTGTAKGTKAQARNCTAPS